MDKKTIERKCLDMTRQYISSCSNPYKKGFNLLLGEVIEGERPDFIISNKYGRVGVEHYLVDTLLGKKHTSRSRAKQGESKFLYNKYCDNLNGNEENALKDVEKIVQSDIDAIQNFDYTKFISEFKRISEEHIKNVDEYKRNKNIDKYIFLIEIPVARNKIIAFDFDSTSKTMKGRNFPFTLDLIAILNEISVHVDYTVLSVMHENYKNCPYMVYVFDSKDFVNSLEKQIKEVFLKFTYDWQTYHIKAKADLKLEKGDKK